MNELLQQLQPALITAISVVLSILIGAAAREVKTRFGLDIELRHREALHSALVSGIRAGLERGPEDAAQVLVHQAVAYARESVPDAIGSLGANDMILEELARGKLLEVVGRLRN